MAVSLSVWYVSFYLVSALFVAATGYLVYSTTEGHHRLEFLVVTVVGTAWLLTGATKLLVDSAQAKYVLSLCGDLLGVWTVAAIGYFATVYTDRSLSLRKPQNAAVCGWVVIAVGGILTQPLLGFQYEAVAVQQEPISYLAVEPGPSYLLGVGMTIGVLVGSIAYFARLFISSSHRPTSSVLLLGVAAAVSLLPNAVFTFQLVPMLPGYDYSVFGLAPFVVVLAGVVFFRGERDLAPMARAEIVDEIDTALFGLDDAGRVVDYNAAGQPLLPGDVDDPIGRPLERLVPDLTDALTLPSDPTGDVTTTYTTDIDGSRTHYSVSVSPIVERETIAGYTVILRDVTAVESAKRKLQRQNDQLESFATTVAHDLRNPLQIATLKTELVTGDLRAAEATVPAVVDQLDRADEAISRMDAILDELETLAEHAQSVTTTEQVAFEAAVRAAWDRVETDDVSLSVPIDGTIDAEPTRLSSILETLVRHSVAHGGSAVVVELTETGFVYEDDGLQIPDAEQEAVFAADTTTSMETTGLGLTIVRTKAESQGWRVEIESTGSGSRFHVTGAETTIQASEVDA